MIVVLVHVESTAGEKVWPALALLKHRGVFVVCALCLQSNSGIVLNKHTSTGTTE